MDGIQDVRWLKASNLKSKWVHSDMQIESNKFCKREEKKKEPAPLFFLFDSSLEIIWVEYGDVDLF